MGENEIRMKDGSVITTENIDEETIDRAIHNKSMFIGIHTKKGIVYANKREIKWVKFTK